MTSEPTEGTTVLLPQAAAHENVMALRLGPDILDELEGLAQTKQQYDLIVIDASDAGYLFATEVLVEAVKRAPKLLTVQGGMLFAKPNGAVAVVRETLMGATSLHVFDSTAEIYDYSPAFARHVLAALGKEEGNQASTDLTQQVLMSSVPVLTQFGIKLKAGMESVRRRNLVLGAIDNYTPVSAIAQRLAGKASLTLDELIEELQALEQVRAIYPVFPRIPFLVHCFRSQIPFKLRDYLTSSRLLTQEQLDELSFEQQNARGQERMSLGALAVAKGYISTRQLEIALQDLAFYGQAKELDSKVKLMTGEQAATVQSLIGHLGTTDPAGLLQNLVTNRESGVLSVENRDLQFRAAFDSGRLTHARVGRIRGNTAIIEFVSVWTEGIFVFIQRQPPADLVHDSCKVTKQVDKLLLDAALAQDNVQVVWNKLPKGSGTPLEKLPDSNSLFQSGKMTDLQEGTPLGPRDLDVMQKVWKALDGLTPVATTIRNIGDITTVEGATAIDRLLHYRLVSIPAMDITGPLEKFRQIVRDVGEKLGVDRNLALLRLSLQAAQGYSVRARMFTIGAGAEVGMDLAAARSAGTSLSVILKDLEDWQVKYIEYVSADLDRNVLRDIVYKAHK